MQQALLHMCRRERCLQQHWRRACMTVHGLSPVQLQW